MAICLAQLRRNCITRIQGEFTKTGVDIGPDMLDPWLSEAYVEIARLGLYVKTDTQALVADQVRYARPSDILDLLISGDGAARVKSSAGRISNVPQRTWGYMVDRYGDFANLDGLHGPGGWCWAQDDPEQIVLFPPPLSSVASGLVLDYVAHPGELSRVYDSDSATCSVTNGSAVVTFASSISGLIEADDTWGIKADADSLPTRWYRVSSIDSTTQITLSSTYAGATDAAALFTASQASVLEWKRPGLIQYAPVEYALARVAQMEQGEQAAEPYRQIWAAALARISIEGRRRPGLQLGPQIATRTHPGLNPNTRSTR